VQQPTEQLADKEVQCKRMKEHLKFTCHVGL